jgi:hypothetical protein
MLPAALLIGLVGLIALPEIVSGQPKRVGGKPSRLDRGRMPGIASVDTDPVRIGSTLTMRGSRFGEERGAVDLELGVFSVSCPVSTWHDDIIVATLPSGMETLLAGKKHQGVIRVKTERGTASKGVSIVPRSGEEPPRIEGVTNTIRPGDAIVVAGRHLGTTAGKVDFVSDGLAPVHGRVLQWKDHFIRVEMPTGVRWNRYADAKVKVQLHRTEPHAPFVHAEKNIKFEPELATRVLVEFHRVEGKASKRLTKRYTDFDQTLENGWQVLTSHLEYTSDPAVSVRWEERPKQGATRATARTRAVKPKGFKYFDLDVVLVIQGPRGTQPF